MITRAQRVHIKRELKEELLGNVGRAATDLCQTMENGGKILPTESTWTCTETTHDLETKNG